MPNPSPLVLQLAQQFRTQLLQRERRAATAMVRYYGQSWQRLQKDVMQLRVDAEGLRAMGEEPDAETLWRLERMQAIKAQTEQELARFAKFADDSITSGQREAIVAGERNAHELLLASFPRDANVQISFATMPREAVEALVGFLGDGSPLKALLDAAVGDAAEGFAQTMITGLTAGWNPRKLAQELRAEYGMGLTRSLTIARTEQLRAYRTANDEIFKRSEVVAEKERVGTLDSRSCLACVMLDGTRYPVDEPMDDHPRGLCVFVPITKSWAEMGIDAPEPDFSRELAQDWFQRQDEATQQQMMSSSIGKDAYAAWKAGQFTLADIPKLRKNSVWGNAWSPKGLAELINEAA